MIEPNLIFPEFEPGCPAADIIMSSLLMWASFILVDLWTTVTIAPSLSNNKFIGIPASWPYQQQQLLSQQWYAVEADAVQGLKNGFPGPSSSISFLISTN